MAKNASTSQGQSRRTKDHNVIRKWAESRGGKPAMVASTQKGESGLLRIKFQDGNHQSLEEVDWDRFFKVFDENDLEFLYQEETKEGQESRFFKFVRAE